MKKFEIIIDLIVTDKNLDAIPDYGNRQVSSYYCKSEDAVKWDITLSNAVQAETPEDAAATITEALREAFNAIDPDWNAVVYQDDDEKIQLYHGVMHRFDELGYLERTNIYTGEPEE